MITRFAKIRDVKSPSRGHLPDAGVDFFIPEYSKELAELIKKSCKNKEFVITPDHSTIGIPANSSVLIPSGIKIEIAHGFMGMFADKSGVASKKELLIGAKVVDTGYSGEVHIDIHNVSDRIKWIEFGEKIVQMIFIPIVSSVLLEVDESVLYDYDNSDDQRGDNGFGSTNKKD